jgi:hypothetical protein
MYLERNCYRYIETETHNLETHCEENNGRREEKIKGNSGGRCQKPLFANNRSKSVQKRPHHLERFRVGAAILSG